MRRSTLVTRFWCGALGAVVAAASAPAPAATLAAADSASQRAALALRTPESFTAKHRALRTIGIIVLQNGVQTLGGRYLMKEGSEGFIVSFESIHENLISGQEWDDNSFSANNFRHPWQGAMYFDAARANGYDFFASSMFALAGSWEWEYMGERHHPSYNDMVNTHIGGIAMGEMMYRLSSLVLDNTATGSGRAWRELGGFLISPTRGFNRLLTGEAYAVHANPVDRIPSHHRVALDFGIRTLGDERLWDSATGRAFVAFEGQYGDPFEDYAKPFDNFLFGMQLNFSNSPHGIGRIRIHGTLGGTGLHSKQGFRQTLAGYQHLDYIDNEAYTYGGQSFGAGYMAQFQASTRTRLTTAVFADGILLGATKSDYPSISGREYDYGPGLGAKFLAALNRDGHDLIALSHETFWVHSVSGTDLESVVSLTALRALIPLQEWNAIGVEYLLYNADRDYALYPRVQTRNPELRAYLSWRID